MRRAGVPGTVALALDCQLSFAVTIDRDYVDAEVICRGGDFGFVSPTPQLGGEETLEFDAGQHVEVFEFERRAYACISASGSLRNGDIADVSGKCGQNVATGWARRVDPVER